MNQHLVAAGNYVLGSTNFCILNLPEGWRLFTGLHPAEVDRSRQIGDVRWVTVGRASYLLHTGRPGGKVELALRIGQGRIERWLNRICSDGSAGRLVLNEHEACYRLRPRRQSWLSRQRGDLLEVVLYCESTGRTLVLEFDGPAEAEQRQALLEALAGTVCH
jgi:hypothetical protein